MKFVGMIRCRDETRWIVRAINSLLRVCDKVHVLDDHSTDGTPQLIRDTYSIAQVRVHDSPFYGFSETRDKDWLLSQLAMREQNTDYVICIDGDEELEADVADKITQKCRYGKLHAAAFHIIYLWDSPEQWRVDGIYRDFYRPSLFKLPFDKSNRAFQSAYSTSLHCSNVPFYFMDKTSMSDICLFHWGYYDRETRIRKYQYYRELDPNNENEDNYRHMVIGDMFPADSQFKHGGPLQLEPLSTLASFRTA